MVKLVEAVGGPGMKKHVRELLPAMLSNLGDPKKSVAVEASNTVNKFIDVLGLDLCFKFFGDVLIDDVKTRLLMVPIILESVKKWKEAHGGQTKELAWGDFTKASLTCMTDKNQKVKKPAQELAGLMCDAIGLKEIKKMFREFKGGAKGDFQKFFAKHEKQNDGGGDDDGGGGQKLSSMPKES
eukprot:TRINITY_DN3602_c0_g1_i1.p2 TRINITY_DN3602_c0_g1~~TRINITY_DN3602_c0_g1_i1.p2  ORF type:complete len:183 (-),score=55.09 TRINITY_DN3602_c0_g1_i1:77-625(-)